MRMDSRIEGGDELRNTSNFLGVHVAGHEQRAGNHEGKVGVM